MKAKKHSRSLCEGLPACSNGLRVGRGVLFCVAVFLAAGSVASLSGSDGLVPKPAYEPKPAYGQSSAAPSARSNVSPRNTEARYGSSGGTTRERSENERIRQYLRSESERRIRNYSLRYALDTIETFGKARFSDNFSLHSSLGWADKNRIEGELRFVVPISAREGRATFLQPGVVLWQANDPELTGKDHRYDFSIGVVRRQAFGLGRKGRKAEPPSDGTEDEATDAGQEDSDTTPKIGAVRGFSLFYDRGRYGHSRAGVGIDFQASRTLIGANYYHPLSGVRTGYKDSLEQALQGADLVFEQGVAERLDFELRAGRWKLKDKDARFIGTNKNSIRTTLRYRVSRSVSVWGGYDSYDKGLGAKSSGRFGVDIQLPKGRSVGTGTRSPELWKPVNRESRIFFERRSDRGSGLQLSTGGEQTLTVGEPNFDPDNPTVGKTYPFVIKMEKESLKETQLQIRLLRSEGLEKNEYNFVLSAPASNAPSGGQTLQSGDGGDDESEVVVFTPMEAPHDKRDGGSLTIPAGMKEATFDLTLFGDDTAEAAETLDFEVFIIPENVPETYEPPDNKVEKASVTIGPASMEILIDPDADGDAVASPSASTEEPQFGDTTHARVVVRFSPAVVTEQRVEITATGDLDDKEFVLETSDSQPSGLDVDTVEFECVTPTAKGTGCDLSNGWVLVAPHGATEVWLSLILTGDLVQEATDEILTLTATSTTTATTATPSMPIHRGVARLSVADTTKDLPDGLYLTIERQAEITVDEPLHPEDDPEGEPEEDKYEVELFVKPTLTSPQTFTLDLTEVETGAGALRRPNAEEFDFKENKGQAAAGTYTPDATEATNGGSLALLIGANDFKFTLTLKSDRFAEDAERLILKATGAGNQGPLTAKAVFNIRKSQHRIAARIHKIVRKVEIATETETKTPSVEDVGSTTNLEITEASLLKCPDGYDCKTLIEDPTGDDVGKDEILLRLLEGRLEEVVELDDEDVYVDIKLRLCRLQTEPAPCPNFGTVGGETRDDIQFQYTDKNGNNQILTPDADNQFTVRFFADQDPVINAIAKNDDDLEGIEQFSLIVYDADVSASIQNFFNIIEDKRNRLLVRIPANDGTIEIGAQEVPANAEGFNCTTAGGLSLDGPYTGAKAFEVEEATGSDGNKVAIVVELDPVVPAGGITLPFALTATPASGGYKLNTDEYDITIPEMCNPEGGTIVTNKDHEKINSGAPINKRNIVKQNEDELEIFIPWRTERFVILVEVSPDTFADAEETLEVEAENLSNFYRTKTANDEKVEIVIPENDNQVLIQDIVPSSSANGSIKKDTFALTLARPGGSPVDGEVITVAVKKQLKTNIDNNNNVYEEFDSADISIPTGGQNYDQVLSADDQTLYLLLPFPQSAVASNTTHGLTLTDPETFPDDTKEFTLTFSVLDDTGNFDTVSNTASPFIAAAKEQSELKKAIKPFKDFFSVSINGGTEITVNEPDSGHTAVQVLLMTPAGVPLPDDLEIRILPTGEKGVVTEGTDYSVRRSGQPYVLADNSNAISFVNADFVRQPSGAHQASFTHRVLADDFAEPDETAAWLVQTKVGGTDVEFSQGKNLSIHTPQNDNEVTLTLERVDGVAISDVSGNSDTVSEVATTQNRARAAQTIDYTLKITLDHVPEGTKVPKMRLCLGATTTQIAGGSRDASQGTDYTLDTTAATGGTLSALVSTPSSDCHALTFASGSKEVAIPFTIRNGKDGATTGDEVFRVTTNFPVSVADRIYKVGDSVAVTIAE